MDKNTEQQRLQTDFAAIYPVSSVCLPNIAENKTCFYAEELPLSVSIVFSSNNMPGSVYRHTSPLGEVPNQTPANREPVSQWEWYTGFEFVELHTKPITWLVKENIPEGISIVAGYGNCGKTTYCLVQFLHIASGKPFCGFDVRRQKVAFLSLEMDHNELKERMDSIMDDWTEEERKRALENLIIFRYNTGFVEEYVRATKTGEIPSVILELKQKGVETLFIDSLVRIFSSSLTDANAVNYVYQRFLVLLRNIGINVVVIAHITKAGAASMDLTSIFGSVDVVNMTDYAMGIMRKGFEQKITIRPLKNRHSLEEAELRFCFKTEGGVGYELLGEVDDAAKAIAKVIQARRPAQEAFVPRDMLKYVSAVRGVENKAAFYAALDWLVAHKILKKKGRGKGTTYHFACEGNLKKEAQV